MIKLIFVLFITFSILIESGIFKYQTSEYFESLSKDIFFNYKNITIYNKNTKQYIIYPKVMMSTNDNILIYNPQSLKSPNNFWNCDTIDFNNIFGGYIMHYASDKYIYENVVKVYNEYLYSIGLSVINMFDGKYFNITEKVETSTGCKFKIKFEYPLIGLSSSPNLYVSHDKEKIITSNQPDWFMYDGEFLYMPDYSKYINVIDGILYMENKPKDVFKLQFMNKQYQELINLSENIYELIDIKDSIYKFDNDIKIKKYTDKKHIYYQNGTIRFLLSLQLIIVIIILF